MAYISDVTFIPNPAGLAELLQSPTGTVGRWLTSQAKAVEKVAKARCPKRSGALRDSIEGVIETTPRGLVASIVAGGPDAPYAMFVHNGTMPHPIEPVNAQVLAFPAAKIGTRGKSKGKKLKRGSVVVFAPSVDHPGTQPNPFLTEALADVMGVLRL